MKLKGYEQMTYYTRKEFAKKYPKGAGGYTVIGLTTKSGVKGKNVETILVDEQPVEYMPFKRLGILQEIKGYLQVGENAYLAVQGSKAGKLFLLILLLLAGVLAAYFGLQKLPKGVVLDPMSAKYEAPIEVSEETHTEYISLPGISRIRIEEGKDTTKTLLWNPDGNPCYFQYTILLQDTGEVIYESGLIAPGNAITEVTFNRTFSRGTYPIIVSMSTFDLTDPEIPLNGGEVEATLVAMQLN